MRGMRMAGVVPALALATALLGAGLVAGLVASPATAAWQDRTLLSLAAATQPVPAPVPLRNGLRAWWFQNPPGGDGLCSSDPASWMTGAPIGWNDVANASLSLGIDQPPVPTLQGNCVGARYIGWIQPPPGTWQFAAQADDAVRLGLGPSIRPEGYRIDVDQAAISCWQKGCGFVVGGSRTFPPALSPALAGRSDPVAIAVDWWDWQGFAQLGPFVRPVPDDGLGWRAVPNAWFVAEAGGAGW